MARSVVNQTFHIQKETTPGTAATNAMNRVHGLRVRPGYTDEGEAFRAEGFKMPTAWIQNNEMGAPTVESIQDFNALTWVLCGAFGAPTTTTPSGATNARQHAYTLSPNGADTLASFTGIWGDSTQAVKMTHLVFQSLQIGVQRGGALSLTTSALSREPETGASIPSSGTTEVPAQPIPARTWDIYADDTWANLGTTKLLAAYEGQITFGDKYTPDYVINSAVTSFDSLIEAENTAYDGTLRAGFDATAIALINTFKTGAMKFLRFEAEGPTIEDSTKYKITIDLAVRITQRGEISSAPNSPAVSLPFTFQIMPDTVSGKAAAATLINTVTAL